MGDFSHLNLAPTTTFEEQIEGLRSRGLIIANESNALNLLQRISYFRLSAYFLSETSFEKIERIYTFDAKLRNQLLAIIEPIEIAFRTQIAYLIAHKYGIHGHLTDTHFRHHDGFLSSLEKEAKRSSDPSISRYIERFGSAIPVWIALEIIPLSVLSRFFSNLMQVDQEDIANNHYELSASYVRSWLKCLNDTRNICAHHGRIYSRQLPSSPKLFKWTSRLNLNKNMIFAQLLAFKNLYLDKLDWNSKMTHLFALLEEYADCISIDHLGFSGESLAFLLHKRNIA
jgi:abortive infection bacteriophage resistance protein